MVVLRILFGILWFPFVYLPLCILGLFVSPNKEYDTHSPFWRFLLEKTPPPALWCANIRLSTVGMDQVPEGRFVLVSNHRSNYDPILTWCAFSGRQLAFISKKENFKIPGYGAVIRRCMFMPIDRESPRRALKTVHQATRLLTEDRACVGIYPEGKRSKSGKLLPFHAGILSVARRARVPIVVVTVDGTEQIHKNIPLRPSPVTLKVCEVLSAETVLEMRSEELSEYIRNRMLEELGK